MIPQALHVIVGFLAHVVEKRFISGIQAASEHEILPDENPHFIAKIIEVVTLVNAAAPDAQHVHVGVAHGLKQFAIFISTDAAREAVRRDPITAFGKDRHAVNHKGEALAGFVALLLEFQRAQARTLRCFIYKLAIGQQSSFESVERMSA